MRFSWLCLLCTLSLLLCQTEILAQKPELVLQSGHANSVSALAFSPDSRLLASGGNDNRVLLWDLTTGKCLRTLSGHEHSLIAVAFQPHGSLIAGMDSDVIRVWDIATGKLVRTLQHPYTAFRTMAFSPDGQILAGGGSYTVLWDMNTGKELRTLKETGSLALCFRPDGKTLLSADATRTVRVWNVEDGQKLQTLDRQQEKTRHIAFGPEGRQMVTSDQDDAVHLWDVEKETILRTWKRKFVSALAVSESSNIVVTSDSDKEPTVTAWDAATGKPLYAAFCTGADALAISPDLQRIGNANSEAIQVKNAKTGSLLLKLRGNAARAYSCVFSPDNRTVVGGSLELRLWDTHEARLMRRLQGGVSCTFRPDGKVLAGASPSITGDGPTHCEVSLWNVANGQKLRTFSRLPSLLKSVEFHPSGETLLTAWSDDGKEKSAIQLWDAKSGKPLRKYPVSSWLFWAGFNPNGKQIGMVVQGKERFELHLLDAATGKDQFQLLGPPKFFVTSLESHPALFSPNGSLIALPVGPQDSFQAYEAASRVQLWNTTNGQPVTLLATGKPLAFSPDSAQLFTVDKENTVAVWDIRSGQKVRTFQGSEQQIVAASLSRDGKRMITCNGDAALTLWDVPTGKEIIRMISRDAQDINFGDLGNAQKGEGEADYLFVTPDNYYLATRGALGEVALRIGNRAYPVEQFDLKLNRPDIVLKRLQSRNQPLILAYEHAYAKRLRQNGMTPEKLSDNFRLPEAKLLSEALPAATNKKLLAFKAEVSDSAPQAKLVRLNVFVNDVPANFRCNGKDAFGAQGFPLAAHPVTRFQAAIELELLPGDNKVQVSALNDQGLESVRETFRVTCETPAAKPDLYVVAVGVSQYANPAYRLRYAHKDAEDIAAFFTSHADSFNKIHVLPVTDADATRANILQKAKDLLKGAKVEDEVVLFFAGHGLLDSKLDYYYGTVDIDFDHPEKQGLAYDAIEGLLDGLAARKKLLLIDTCHSGEVDKAEADVPKAPSSPAPKETPALPPGVKAQEFPRGVKAVGGSIGLQNSFAIVQELFSDLRHGSGAAVISAASGEGYSLENEQWKNGAFTASLLEGLLGTPDITVSGLRKFVSDRVLEITRGRQTPTSRQESLEYDWRIY